MFGHALFSLFEKRQPIPRDASNGGGGILKSLSFVFVCVTVLLKMIGVNRQLFSQLPDNKFD